MRLFSRGARSAVVCLVLLGALSACGGEKATDAGTPGRAPTSASPTASSSASSSEKTQVVRLQDYDISFEIPAGWTKISADGVLTADSPMVTGFAEKLGRSPKDVLAMMKSSLKMMAVSDEGMDAGFLENINAVDAQMKSITTEQLKVQLLAIGAKITGTEEGESALGEVHRVSYSLGTGTTSYGCALALNTGDTVIVVTASAHSASDTEDRIDQVQATLARL